MTFEVRARHTTTVVVSVSGSYRRFVSPARNGDAHLVGPDGVTLCGKKAEGWSKVTSRRWVNLGAHRCDVCQTALVEWSAGPDSGRPPRYRGQQEE
jgi:hypothetical protein